VRAPAPQVRVEVQPAVSPRPTERPGTFFDSLGVIVAGLGGLWGAFGTLLMIL